MTEKTNGSKEFWKGIQANCDHADEALERILNRYPYMRDNADWHDIAALINGIRMMSFELEPDKLDIMPYAGYKNDEFYATITYQQGGKDDGKWGVEIEKREVYRSKVMALKELARIADRFHMKPIKHNEKPPTAATEDGQTGKSLENEYPSLF